MKKENLETGKKVKIVKLITDFNGALYEGDVVHIIDWTIITENPEAYIVYVNDMYGKLHNISLTDIDDC